MYVLEDKAFSTLLGVWSFSLYQLLNCVTLFGVTALGCLMMKAEPQECCVSTCMLLRSMNFVAFHIETPHHTTSAPSLPPSTHRAVHVSERPAQESLPLILFRQQRQRNNCSLFHCLSSVSTHHQCCHGTTTRQSGRQSGGECWSVKEVHVHVHLYICTCPYT